MAIYSGEKILFDIQMDQALDALLAAQEKGDAHAAAEAKNALGELQKKRIILEL